MTNSQEVNCALGIFAAAEKYAGAVIDDEVLFEALNNPHSKAVYADAGNRYINKVLGAENTGLFSRVIDYMADGSRIIGEENVSKIDKLFRGFLETHSAHDEAAFKKEIKPQVEAIYNTWASEAPAIKQDLGKKYFDHQINGGSLFGQKGSVGPLGEVAQNAVGNLVSWNPMITTMNAFEFMPKALAYTIEKQRPDAILHGISKYLEKTGGQFWKRIPELEQLGIYGTRDHLGKGFNLLDTTENPLRGISYYIGEAISPGLGSEALEKIAFVHRYGNEPMVFLDHSGTLSFTLMRYSLSSTKFYLNMLKGIKSGDPKAAMAFMAFTAMTAAQTGVKSAIPLPLDAGLDKLLGDDYKDALKEFDDKTGFNFTKKYLGTDLTQYAQPVGGMALGAGYNIATQDVAGGFRAIGKGLENTGSGDYKTAAANYLQAGMGFGQLGRFKGVNLLTKRMVDALAEVAAGDVDAQDYGTEVLRKTHVLNEPPE